jgi:G3E family GTPase
MMAPIEAATLNLGERLDWPALTVWLSALIHARGDGILRIKGVVRTPRGRLLLQSVRKVVQSPEILPDEPATSDTGDNSLVLIGRRFTADALARSLKAFGIESGLTIQPRMEMSENTRAGSPSGVAPHATDPSLSRFRAS